MLARPLTAALTAPMAILVGTAPMAPAQGSPPPRVVAGSVPGWVGAARLLGPADARTVVEARVYLAPRGGLAALRRTVIAASTPDSPRFRNFLTAAQYHARFDPLPRRAAAVRNWLAGSGLHITITGPYRDYFGVRGTVAAAQRAFGTRIGRFLVRGRLVRGPMGPLHAPASVASAVLTVTGFDTAPVGMVPVHVRPALPPPGGVRDARPCSLAYGQLRARFQADFKTPLPHFAGRVLPYAPCGYTGPQYRSAYERNSPLTGRGVTVAITDAYSAPTVRFDANHYALRHGDGGYAPDQLRLTLSRPFRTQRTIEEICKPAGWENEQTLDIEAVHAMAPAARIRYYGARSCLSSDLRDALTKVVDDDRAQVVTNSWGTPEEFETVPDIRADEKVFLQGAIEGISFLFSTGDDGDEVSGLGVRQVEYPASDPLVTAVGGTTTAITGTGTLRFSTGWGTREFALAHDDSSWRPDGAASGSGGGQSSLFNRPNYQRGIVHSAFRSVPDVAMDADPTTGMLVGETQQFPAGTRYDEYRLGGTSLAAPLLAGFTAIALQHHGAHGVGPLNPVMYRDARKGLFDDVKSAPPDPGNVRVDFANSVNATGGLEYAVEQFNHDSSLRVTAGWDDVTGLGVPTPRWLRVVGG